MNTFLQRKFYIIVLQCLAQILLCVNNTAKNKELSKVALALANRFIDE